jgi:chaperonin GroES
MRIVPRNDKIVIRKVEPRKTTKGGLFLPDTAKDDRRSLTGQVVEVGPGRPATKDDLTSSLNDMDEFSRVPHGIKVGNVVIFGRYQGWETSLNDEDFVVLEEKDVLAVVAGARTEEDKDGKLRLAD